MARHGSRFARGFSLIEVLIAVVVLSFGLLALTALQARLMQASSEAKAQSIAIALAKAKLEELRAYSSLDDYRALTSSTAAESISDSSGNLGGVNYRRQWVVDRYAWPRAGGGFDNSVPLTGALNTTTYAENNEFKTIRVEVTWTDANGSDRTVVMEDAIAAIDPKDSARNRVNRTSRPRGPQVLIYNPAGEAGVIPIAIGNGTDTAATNPKPEVVGRNNSQAVVETRFDVLTYAALSGNTALAQARVETAVIGCKCDYGNAPSSSVKAYRPVHWNGFRYAPPQVASYSPPAGAATLRNSDPPQSRLCEACCRNHHDPSSLAAGEPKFDPWRSPHAHYNIVNGVLTQVTSGEYIEACRMIRTDGIFDVAADMSNDYFNLLETASSAQSPVPSTAAVSSYQDFVKDYLDARFRAGSSSGYNNRASPSPAAYATSAQPQSLDVPSEISIARTRDERWLHARGLYIDYLEKVARDAIDDAKSQCADQSSTGLLTCVLRVLPFTSINLTEIARWATSTTTQLVVTNNDFIESLTSNNPVRGKATPGSNPQPNDTPTATGRITASNSGVALYAAVDPDDATDLADTQNFRITGSSPPPGTGGNFTVNLGGGLTVPSGGGRIPGVAFSTGSQTGVTCNPSAPGTPTYPSPYLCTAQALGGSTTILASNYNYQINKTSTVSLTCTHKNGSSIPYSGPAPVKICRNFALISATLNGLPAGLAGIALNDGRMNESTTVQFTAVNANDVIGLIFSDPVDTQQPVTCTYTGNSSNPQFEFSSPDCP